ncbi:MAG TPA: hypothetical protein VM580_01675 [Labilithrix sp.]|nr:hypothetical protein [Labilithrix sp.]
MLARAIILALSLPTALGCGSSGLHVAGAPSASHYLENFEGKPSGVSLGAVRFKSDVCRGVDVSPVGRPLDADAFVAFLKSQGLDTRTVRARHDLVLVDVLNAGTPGPVRFRVAELGSPGAAGHELHTALLQKGQGTWGIVRGNLAILAPTTSANDAVVFAGKTRLACWGVFMIAGLDDTFVIPGGYTEL